MKQFFSRTRDRIIWSWEGLATTFREEHSFRYWVWANVASAILVFVLPLDSIERALILALGMLVMAFELINTAVEDAIDYISTDIHPLAKRAKDAASASVALSAAAVGVAWVVILVGLYAG